MGHGAILLVAGLLLRSGRIKVLAKLQRGWLFVWAAGLAAMVFGAMLVMVVVAYYWTKLSRTFLFWAAFILTRPLGAVVGDFLDKPLSAGGLALSRYSASAALFGFILTSILLFKQRAAKAAH